jgi:5-bromo-4-chloroindolyl phosphate hydrolysis protein
MGLFIKKEEYKKYIYFKRRKFTLSFSFVPLILVMLGIVASLFAAVYFLMVLSVLFLLSVIFGIIMAAEGIYYGSILPKRYAKMHKKIVRQAGKGIKIYK